MIKNSLRGILDISKFYKVIIFDILIGNSDRHHSNWAILAKEKVYKTPENMFDIFLNMIYHLYMIMVHHYVLMKIIVI